MVAGSITEWEIPAIWGFFWEQQLGRLDNAGDLEGLLFF
jgi:hypothetical protein